MSTVAGKSLLTLIERYLREGLAIEIDGRGSFALESDNVVFKPSGRPATFLAYAEEDRAHVKRLYRALHIAGFEPWMDQEKLLAGQNWPRAIQRAIEMADFFISCFSRRSTVKRGHFQCELRYALDVAERVPLDETFLIPVRLENCEVPKNIARNVQYIDLFPDWDEGVERLIKMLRQQAMARQKKLKLAS